MKKRTVIFWCLILFIVVFDPIMQVLSGINKTILLIIFCVYLLSYVVAFVMFSVFLIKFARRIYKNIGGSEGAMRILEHRITGGLHLRQSPLNWMEGISVYQDYEIAFDTNVLLDNPRILEDVARTNPILLSKQVFYELDGLKKDLNLEHDARTALAFIETLHHSKKLRLVPVDLEYIQKVQLNPNSPDDKIVAGYLKEQQNGARIVFVSKDRGARLMARDLGLEVLNMS